MLDNIPDLKKYVDNHTSPESSLLYDLNRETHLKTLRPIMVSGHYQGRLLAMISQMIQPKRVLELGTFTGYATICLAEGLTADGVVHTIEKDPELEPIIQKYIDKANLTDKVQLHFGDANQVLETLEETFDLVFIDANKKAYSNYFDVILPKVRQGGFIMADNILWKGKVYDDAFKKDKMTRYMDDYNKKIQADERVDNVLLPIRDGIMIARKR